MLNHFWMKRPCSTCLSNPGDLLSTLRMKIIKLVLLNILHRWQKSLDDFSTPSSESNLLKPNRNIKTGMITFDARKQPNKAIQVK